MQESLDKALILKEQGNAYFKSDQTQKAMRSYHESMLQVKGLDTTCIMIPNQSQTTQAIEPQFKEAIHSITKSINLNLSACYVRLEKWEKCADLTKKILSEDKDSIKALYRCGLSLFHLDRVDECEEMVKRALAIDNQDIKIRELHLLLSKRNKELNHNSQLVYKKMFKSI